MYRKVAIGDLICVCMKNIHPNKDGVYVVGTGTSVEVDDGTFRWKVDKTRSARTSANPSKKTSFKAFSVEHTEARCSGYRLRRKPIGWPFLMEPLKGDFLLESNNIPRDADLNPCANTILWNG